MAARQPLTAVMKIAELGRVPRSKSGYPAVSATELRKLLSRPLAPLSDLDQRERRKITDARLAGLAAALAEVRPTWIADYAASAAVALPLRERRLRDFMLQELFRSQVNPARALAALATHLRQLSEKHRMSVLIALLSGLAKLSDVLKPVPFEDVERSLKALIAATQVRTSAKAFAQLALRVALAAEKLSAGSLPVRRDGGQPPVSAILPYFDEAHRGFLLRSRWGTLAPEINAVLWHQLWRSWREASSPNAPEPTQQNLLKGAAWSEADQAVARALQDAGRLIRSLDKFEAAGGETAARAEAVRGASILVLQWIRQAARLRNLDCVGTFGNSTEFDPVLHESHDAMPGDRVRIVKPTVVRSNGSQQSVVLRGEVELE
jgi:hypothetical protein